VLCTKNKRCQILNEKNFTNSEAFSKIIKKNYRIRLAQILEKVKMALIKIING